MTDSASADRKAGCGANTPTPAVRPLRLGLVQTDVRLGRPEDNAASHLAWIDEGRRRGLDLLAFPELSLTGYRLLHLASRLAIEPRSSPLLAGLAERAAEMAVVVGFVEKGCGAEAGALWNSAVLLREGRVEHVHRKLFLPSYGLFQEGRTFTPGRRLDLVAVASARLGMLICEDLWHPEAPARLARGGADLILVLSAGPGHLGPGAAPATQERWELLSRSAALTGTTWVAYVNRVGWEEGVFFPGGSHVVGPDGRIVARAPFFDEHLLTLEVDLDALGRARAALPVLAQGRPEIEGPAG